MIQDIRFALRSLRRRPVIAAIAITTIALGSGAATSIFSVVDGVLLRPLPFRNPERLVAIWETSPEWRKNDVLNRSWDNIPLSLPEYRDIADRSTSFDHVAVWHERPMRLAGGDNEERVRALRSSRSLLAVLGADAWPHLPARGGAAERSARGDGPAAGCAKERDGSAVK